MNFDQEIIMCEHCGGYPACENHHIFYGTADRKISDRYDFMQIKLCRRCHDAAHNLANVGYDLNKDLRKQAQWEFIKRYSEKEFMALIKKNYFDEEE